MKLEELEDLYELSATQQGMLFHELYHGIAGVYIAQMTCRLRGALDLRAFEHALQALVDRHPVLRTSLHWRELDKPLQMVHRQAKFELEQADLRDQNPAAHREHIERAVTEQRLRGMPLDKPPLARMLVIQLGPELFQLVWTYHHVVLDGWSFTQLVQELLLLYEARHSDDAISLPPVRPFRDYVSWFQRQDFSQAEDYWRRTLAGFSELTPLPTKRNIDAAQPSGTAGAEDPVLSSRVQLSPEVSSRLAQLARRLQMTDSSLAQAAWALLLSRYSGRQDVVFGVACAGRPTNLPGSEAMVGLFLNTLPIRLAVKPADAVESWLRDTQNRQADLRHYEYTPLVEVQRWSELPPGSPLFESILVFENLPDVAQLRDPGLSLQVESIEAVNRTNYPLTATVYPGSQWEVEIACDRLRFDASIVGQMAGHFAALLTGLAERPSGRLLDIPMLSDEQRRQVLIEWNRTENDYPQEQRACDLFACRARRSPERTAARFDDETISYGQLDRRANQLAHHLRTLSVGPEVQVGVCLERSSELLTVLLAIHKAGGAYLPLDPAYPADRLALMLEDSGAPLVITSRAACNALPDHQGRQIVLEEIAPALATQPEQPPRVAVAAENLAYVIYTSGSTGRPKGVMISHGAMVNFLISMTREPGIEEQDRLLAVTSLSFDIHVLELFAPLLAGAEVIIADRDTAADGLALARLITGSAATVMQATPATWRLLIDSGWNGDPRLKVLCGGEALPPDLAEQLLARAGALWNMYGPTETTVWSTIAHIQPGDTTLTIGHPIANTQVYILDDQLDPVPIGAAGELYIAGASVARGYGGRPDLTADRFLPDPFSGQPAQMYRTGDLCRWREDGQIDFLGRVDHQVKVRGFRIELGEIEAILAIHPAVGQVAVVSRQEAPGNNRLIGYVVPAAAEGANSNASSSGSSTEDGAASLTAELRSHVGSKLPDYMVPSLFVLLDAMPLTPNGKINRRALPEPDGQQLEPGSVYVAPRTDLERELAAIWCDVLALQRVGVEDNFFELGGHSLLATQLISRVRRNHDVELPLRLLFANPTVASLALAIEDAEAASHVPPIVKVEQEGPLPLSFGQERLWFLDQLAPGSAAYNMPGAVRMVGPLDIGALQQALHAVVERHQTLRMRFEPVAGKPVALVEPWLEIELPLVDLRDLPAADRQAEVTRRLEREGSLPFDLRQGPLLRGEVMRLSAREHVVALSMHHIISDGWSLGVLLGELAQFYKAIVTGESAQIPPLPVQYSDFAHWQRNWFTGERLQEQLAFWREELREVPSLELPTDHARPAVHEFRGASCQVNIPGELTNRLKDLSRREDATLFMTLMAAFQMLLARYAGQDDLVVGTPVAGRLRPELESLIGFFVNSLPLRGDLSGDPLFTQLLARIRRTALAAMGNQDIPFERLVDELAPERELSRTPIFQVMFGLQNMPAPDVALPRGLQFVPIELGSQWAKFDLTLLLFEQPAGITGQLLYNADLFEPETARRLVQHFEQLLADVAARPQARLSELSLGGGRERELLAAWNETGVELAGEGTWVDAFLAQAEAQPEAVALLDGERQVTFAELAGQSQVVAHYLVDRGVGREEVIGIQATRRAELLIGILGIQRAGAAYLPLDPALPPERLGWMLADAKVRFVLTIDDRLQALEQAATHDHIAFIAIPDIPGSRDISDTQAEPPHAAALPAILPEQLAYVIYTSGSTGRPKGVMVEHRSLHNYLQWYQRAIPSRPELARPAVTNAAFDASLKQLLGPLAAGECVWLLRDEETSDPAVLLERLSGKRQVHLNCVPSLWRMLLAELEERGAELPALRILSLGGEALDGPLLERTRTRLPRLHIYNLYGPTEATVNATAAQLLPGGRPTIGRPIANVQAYVLDRHHQPLPAGVPGELYLGGTAVARGYLGNARQTAELFLPDPFGSAPGGRLYRTGDRCRWREDGQLEFLGRFDEQIKLRGYRIELGEIQSVLASLPAVAQAAVVLRPLGNAGEQIIGYIVPAAGQEDAEAEALRAQLARHLPEYMLPAAIVVLESLPLTSTGKLDRRALPSPDSAWRQSPDTLTLPRTPIEAALADIWKDLLGLEQVGIHQNFFQAGGHSLLAIQLLARVRQQLEADVPLRELFLKPTIAQLAGCLESGEFPSISGAIQQLDRNGRLPLSFAQERMWFLDRLSPENAFYNLPAAARVAGRLDVAALTEALNGIIARHEILRSTFPEIDGEPMLSILATATIDLPVTDLSHLATAEQEQAALEHAVYEARRPFDLARGPLLRGEVVRFAENDHVVLVTLHHIISDGWSTGILLGELAELYAARQDQRTSELAPLPLQYVDYAAWQREQLQGELFERELECWQTQLANLATLDLPTDRPRPAVQSTRGRRFHFSLPAHLHRELEALAAQHDATLFMALLASFQVLLSRYAREQDIPVGTPVAGRTRPEVAELIGLFVNTLVIRGDFSGDPTFEELLPRVRQTVLAAISHQELPFERLVDALQPERDLSRSPLFQVMFDLQHERDTEQGLPGGLTFRPLDVEPGVAKFDLTLIVTARQDGLAACFEYNTDLFDEATIARLAEHWQTLLESLVRSPRAPLSRHCMLGEVEARWLLEQSGRSATQVPYRSIPEQFAAVAAENPAALAIRCGETQLTYGELDRRSMQLARALSAAGVGAEDCVAVCLPRVADCIVSLLGILRCGGVYVPLEPELPPARLEYMLSVASPGVIITSDELRERLPASPAITVTVDELTDAGETAPVNNCPACGQTLQPEQLAYIIFTSGSTGRPKAAQITHGAIARHIDRMRERYGAAADDRWLQFASLSFDASLEQILVPLTAGVPLLMRGEGHLWSAEEFTRELAAWGCTVINLPPAYFQQWISGLAEGEHLPRPPLRMVILGGDAVTAGMRRAWETAGFPEAQLVNAYGPTEATITSSLYRIDPSRGVSGEVTPIGRPAGVATSYILDANLEPVPIGVPGELCLGGDGVSRGYRDQPGLTAERFLPDPFCDRPGARMYRTGDVCRWLPDGIIEFRGRADHQVKIRGFRIELGEVESALGLLPDVQQAVVVVEGKHAGGKRLVGYVELERGASHGTGHLREQLAQSLPHYMVPAAIVSLERLPRTASGKIDRRALPPLEGAVASPGRSMLAPRNETEETLARIWADVLRLERIGVEENFFQLGGDSILSIQIVAKAAKVGLHFSPQQLFQNQTVAQLASVAQSASAVTAEQGPLAGPLPLLPIQARFLAGESAAVDHYNQAAMLAAQVPLNATLLRAAIEHLVEHHDALRLRFPVADDGCRRPEIAPVATARDAAPFKHIDLRNAPLAKQGHRRETLAAEVQASLHLEQGPIFRAVWFEGGPGEDRLLLVAHHLAVDGVSWRILLEDLQTAYSQLSAGSSVQLPPKTTSVREWALRLRNWASDANGALTAEDHWRGAAQTDVPPLPLDHKQGENDAASAATEETALGRIETENLLQRVPAAYRLQINDVLLSALALAMAEWTGDSNILVDLEGHGREAIGDGVDLSRTVGWFTSIYPVPLEVSDRSPGSLLKSIKEQLRAIPHRGLSYGVLRYLGESEALRRELAQSKPEILFNYFGQLDGTADNAAPLAPTLESPGPMQAAVRKRPHLLAVDCSVIEGTLRARWTYSRNHHRRETAARLAERFTHYLRALIDHCLAPDARGATPSDFPLAGLHQAALDRLLSEPENVEDIYPLSPMQTGLLWHSLAEPASGTYVEQVSCLLTSDGFQPAVFQQAWQSVIDRHQILRAGMLWEDVPRPLQMIHRQVTLPWHEEDWRSLPADEQEKRLQALLERHRREGFSLTDLPLMKLALLRVGDHAWRLAWSHHHLLLDGWSLPVLMKEVLLLYQAGATGSEAALPPVRPFRDYIAWLDQQNLDRARRFWQDQLAGFAEPTPLPGASASKSDTTAKEGYARRSLELSPERTRQIEQFARGRKLTLNTLLQAAWAWLLCEHSGRDDVLFGATVSGRSAPVPGIEGMVGLFINTVPVRVRFDPQQLLGAWLLELQERQGQTRGMEHSPLWLVQQWSEVSRGRPLFESLLVVENYPIDEALQSASDDLAIEDVRTASRTNYPLTLGVNPGERLRLRLGYQTNRYDDAAIDCLLQRFEQVLSLMVSHPGTPLCELSLPLKSSGQLDRRALPPMAPSQADTDRFTPPGTPIEVELAGIWKDLLGLEQVGIHQNFFAAGGHSLLAMQLLARVRQRLEAEVSTAAFYNNPTIAALAAAVEKSPTKLAEPLTPFDRSGPLPVSFGQERLWLLDQLTPGDAAYHVSLAVHARGPLELAALAAAFGDLAGRHEILRTHFSSRDGQPCQIIASSVDVTPARHELCVLPKAQQQEELDRLRRAEAGRPFDLSRGPLWRVSIASLAADEHVVMLTLHHIIFDGWSSGVLLRDLAELYEAHRRQEAAELPPLEIQFADFAAWQREWLQGERLEEQLGYWRGQLAEVAPLDLPTDRPRTALTANHGGRVRFELSEPLTQAIRSLSADSASTPFMTLLAGYQLLLSRYARSSDVPVGVPVAGRTRPEVEGLIGFFINTLVMRTDLSGDPTVEELLARVRRTALDAYAHQDLPFERLVEALQPDRDLSRPSLFDTMFVMQNAPLPAVTLPGDVQWTPLPVTSDWAKFDITLTMWEEQGHFAGSWEYNADLFDQATIERMAAHFEALLAAVTSSPAVRLSQLSFTSPDERRLLLEQYNQTAADYPAVGRAHQLFEQQAAATPDAVAAAAADGELTYGELDANANQWAHWLRRQGVGPDVCVAICLPRMLPLVPVMLGVLKAGGALVPINPEYPEQRSRFIAEQSGALLVITTGDFADRFAGGGMRVVTVEDLLSELGRQPCSNPTISIDPQGLAYVMFTSGSTGQPKGVMVHHRGLVNYLCWCQEAYPLDRGAEVPVHSSIAFDLTVTSLLAPLTTGRAICLLPDDAGVEGLLEVFRAKRDLSLVKLTPAHLDLLQSQIDFHDINGRVGALVIGGENLTAESVQVWQQHAPQTRLFNEYGPTETVVGCCVFELPADGNFSGSIPIGRPIRNTRLYVVDAHLQPVARGVPGELLIGGDGVTRGYIGRPDLTAARYIPDPFSGVEGARVYRSGDLCRWLPDGQLEFLGRTDQQVKLRGYRIELGEIEAALQALPAIGTAVAIVREDTPGDRRLVAYVVPAANAALYPGTLREQLRRVLPDYMVPAIFVTLDELPLTANGKIHRAALPQPQEAHLGTDRPFVAPRNATEEQLVAIWRDVLGRERIGVTDNFFELGGHSLLATQVLSRVRDIFDLELPLRDLFADATVTHLAACIEKASGRVGLPPITTAPREVDLPAAFGQERIWFVDQLLGENNFYNIPAAVRLRGELNISAAESALGDIVDRHEALRTTFAERDGRPIQVINKPGTVALALPVEDLTSLAPEDRAASARSHAEREAKRGFDLTKGPLLRVRLYRLAEDDHIAVVTMHHIVSDGWSMQVFLQEFAARYQAHASGHRGELPALPLQYADYAHWQRHLFEQGMLAPQLDYWRERLAGLPLLELPTDRPRGAMQTQRGANYDFSVDPELTENLFDLARQSGATLFMVLLCGYQTLLSRYARQEDVGVGIPIAGRNRAQLEELIGFFVNNLVLRTNLSGDPTFGEALERVRTAALEAFAHQDIPYDKVVESLRPGRATGQLGLFSVAFAMQNAPRRTVTLPGGLALEPILVEGTTARCDLTLFAWEQDGRLHASLEYNTDLFDRATIARLAGHYLLVLQRMVENPHEPITARPLLTQREQQALLHGSGIPPAADSHASPRGAPLSPATDDLQNDLDTDELIL